MVTIEPGGVIPVAAWTTCLPDETPLPLQTSGADEVPKFDTLWLPSAVGVVARDGCCTCRRVCCTPGRTERGAGAKLLTQQMAAITAAAQANSLRRFMSFCIVGPLPPPPEMP